MGDRIRAILVLTALTFLAILLSAMQLGCHNANVAGKGLELSGNAASQAQVRVEYLGKAFETIRKKCPTVKELADEGRHQASQALVNLHEVLVGINQTNGDVQALKSTAQTWHDRYEAETDRFFSAKQRRYGWISGALILAGIALRAFARFATMLPGAIARIIDWIGTIAMCLSFFGIGILYVESVLKRKKLTDRLTRSVEIDA